MRSVTWGPLILHHNCVALPHCNLLHRSCDVTSTVLQFRMKVKFILTWNAVMLLWLAAESNLYIGITTQLRCSMNRPLGFGSAAGTCVLAKLLGMRAFSDDMSKLFQVKLSKSINYCTEKVGLEKYLQICILYINVLQTFPHLGR